MKRGTPVEITELWMRKNSACRDSYSWIRKQKDRNWKSIAIRLYKEAKFSWCFWLLYRKTILARIYVWTLIFLSFLLSATSIYMSLKSGNIVAAIVAAIVAVAVAAIVAAIVAVADGVAVAAIATTKYNFIVRFGCKLALGKLGDFI